ncbi:MAG TPA: anhydro-N-acetylmuramic acid kinase, partial [Legionellaceae bacterium]|nr:anhydro-N-acetylmuramic acid kinase [Legionellaceae bacterium]
MTIYMGLMSGTSMDGIDAALIDIEKNQLLGGIIKPYDALVREQLNAMVSDKAVSPSQLWQLHTLLGRQFAEAANALLESSSYSPQQIKAIGSHGQTIGHDALAPIPYTIQLGCPHTISELTGITVVADF